MTAALAETSIAIRAGRILAIRQAPYLASALLRMVLVETAQVSTAGVDDRWRAYWNPAFAATMSAEELSYVWLHEVSHCLRSHPSRWQAVNDPERLCGVFNVAGDALINADLDDITTHRPTDRIQLDRLGVTGARRGLSVEELYSLLLGTSDPDGRSPRP